MSYLICARRGWECFFFLLRVVCQYFFCFHYCFLFLVELAIVFVVHGFDLPRLGSSFVCGVGVKDEHDRVTVAKNMDKRYLEMSKGVEDA